MNASSGRKPRPKDLAYRTKKSLGTDNVDQAWVQLEEWFAEHIPELYRSLNPPASERDLKAFERELGEPLPASFKASYGRHDGQSTRVASGILMGLPLLSLADIRRQHRNWRKPDRTGLSGVVEDRVSCFPHEAVQPTFVHEQWFPICDDDDGNHIAIDMSPGPRGTSGQVIVCGRYKLLHSVLALNFAQFLSDIAHELHRGNWTIEMLGDDAYLELAAPRTSYLVDIGASWSRHKLGLRRLSKENQAIWDKHVRH